MKTSACAAGVRPAIAVALLLDWAPALGAHTDVTADGAHSMVVAVPGLLVVDVREVSEYCGGHIPGASNLPWNSGALKARYGELPADAEILVVCASGSRSQQAAAFLDGKGYSRIHDMLKGMSAWKWETVFILNFLFTGGPAPPAPFPTCGDGSDLAGGLPCGDFTPCR